MARLVVGLVAAALMVAFSWYVYDWTPPAIPRYSFDVTDRRELSGRAAHVCFGRVAEMTAQSTFQVEIEECLKGDLTGGVLIRQHPGDDQPLVVGTSYLLALSTSAARRGAQVLLPGPLSGQAVSDEADRARIRAEWHAVLSTDPRSG